MIDGLLCVTLEARYHCLDVFPMNWPPVGIEDPCSDCAILLEIWRAGCLIHTGMPIPEDSSIGLVPNGRIIQARVACEPDDHYGFLVQVSVNPGQYKDWFPESYCPADLRYDFQSRN
jgi:hypothetical protein